MTEHYAILAYHFAKGEEWAKALEYFRKAAEQAAQAFANREAVALYDQALEAASHLGDTVALQALIIIHQAKADLYFMLSDFERARAEGERLLVLARRVGDRASEGAALAGMGHASHWAHDFDRALAYARQAIAVAEAGDTKPVLAAGLFVTGRVYSVTGQLDQAREAWGKALTISRAVSDVARQALLLCYTGFLKNWEGNFVEASQLQSEGLGIAREHNLLVALLAGLQLYGVTLAGKGDYDEAHVTFEEGLALSEKVDDEVQRHRLLDLSETLYDNTELLADARRRVERLLQV
ncbi:MAG: hypothetical protein L0177_15140, partial [Chloroflexi bacterium]|nr:hypothetical protein [Chloroflexota bacterium]